MLLLEVFLSLSIVTILAVMLMGNLGYLFARGQKEKVDFSYETELEVLDLMVLKLFEELLVQLPTSSKGHLPLYIEERGGGKQLLFFISHPLDADEKFRGLLKCTLIHDHGSSKLIEENENHVKREIVLMQAKAMRFEFFDAEAKEWVENWEKEKEAAPSLVRIIVTRGPKEDVLYYHTPFYKTPLAI